MPHLFAGGQQYLHHLCKKGNNYAQGYAPGKTNPWLNVKCEIVIVILLSLIIHHLIIIIIFHHTSFVNVVDLCLCQMSLVIQDIYM